MLARRDSGGDLGQVQPYRLRVAPRQDQTSCLARRRTDGAEDVGRRRALVLRRGRPGAVLGPAPGNLVLLPDPGFVGEPNLYVVEVCARRAPDRVQTRGETFSKASIAPVA